MEKTVYRVWSEWDIGHDMYYFTSTEDAKKFVDEGLRGSGAYGEGDTLEDFWGDLVGVERLELFTNA